MNRKYMRFICTHKECTKDSCMTAFKVALIHADAQQVGRTCADSAAEIYETCLVCCCRVYYINLRHRHAANLSQPTWKQQGLKHDPVACLCLRITKPPNGQVKGDNEQLTLVGLAPSTPPCKASIRIWLSAAGV